MKLYYKIKLQNYINIALFIANKLISGILKRALLANRVFIKTAYEKRK
jgi:hypothetical protein